MTPQQQDAAKNVHREWRRRNPNYRKDRSDEQRERVRVRRHDRYHNDPDYREELKRRQRTYYERMSQDDEWRRQRNEKMREVMKRPENRARTRVRVLKRKRIKANVSAELIDSEAIFQRDGWICQLCFEEVDPLLFWPHPESPSLDHIVPLSLGGSHTEDNVQLAHLRCNISKGNRYEVAL